MFGDTYSLGLVTAFLDANGIPYTYNNARVGFSLYNHGCRVKINDTYHISIQTHPDIAGNRFAETALQNLKTQQLVEDGTFGYTDVMRFPTPQDLFDHIKKCMEQK